MSIYILKSVSNTEEYIRIKGSVSDLRIPAMKSDIHLISKDRVEFEITDEGGFEVPDIIYYEGIYLISDRVKELMELNAVDYVFWKGADIRSKTLGINEKFWIIIPPRIDCLDIDKSDIDYSDWDYKFGIVPMFEYTSLHIVPKLVGRFEVFKIMGVMDNNIYVTEDMYKKIMAQNYIGIDFIKLQ